MSPPVRTDIQALRGIAVLAVVFYHAGIGRVNAGYLGVDIFFVISGFLITGLVAREKAAGRFSFREFYARRAKRLLPAAYATFLAAALAAPLFLNAKELRDFAAQMAGAVTFTGNVVLWRQTGYFEGSADLKPLLYVWSLAIEEQYYLLLPAALALIPRRRWLVSAVIVCVASLVACLALGPSRPAFTFYSLPTRAWEIALGSVIALGAPMFRFERHLLWPAVAGMIALCFVPLGAAHPGIDALLVCVATALIIRQNAAPANNGIVPRLLARIGDASYSLYLVHWPIFAFARNAWYGNNPGHPPFAIRLRLLIVAAGVSYVVYRWIETPVRRGAFRFTPKRVAGTVMASLLLVAVPVASMRILPNPDSFAQARLPNYGFHAACELGAAFIPKSECTNSDAPRFLVWGDSYAMSLVAGIATSTDRGVVQATRSMCGPFLGVAPIGTAAATLYTEAWARNCLSFNASVVDHIARTPSIGVVVLSSWYRQYLPPEPFTTLRIDGQRARDSAARVDAVLQSLRQTIDTLHAMNRRVVLVAPPPSTGFPIADCLEREARRQLTFGTPPACALLVTRYRRAQFAADDLLARARTSLGAAVFSFDPFLCDATTCQTSWNGTFLYRDAGHLSREGSRVLGREISLAAKLDSAAR